MTTTSAVPGRFPVALDGHPYVVDDSQAWGRQSVPLIRQQADSGESPSERSINPEDLWRRGVDSWHLGAGQTYFDRPTSDPNRFLSSKGVDVWTRGKLSLLADTASKRSSVNTNLALAPAGSRLYVTDGTELRYTTDVTATTPTWTNVTGVPANAATSIASDGFNVWTAHGTNGIYATNTGSATTASYVTGTAAGAIVGFVKGRLMVADLHKLYNITAAGALPAALFTANNTDFRFVGFAEGPANLYAAGFSGDKSLIYRTAVKTDGTALDAPVVAGELPDGEIVRAIQGYLGYLVIGTDKGVRFASLTASGDLVIGSLITTASAVRCFEGQDRFVWFGWTNYDGTSTGLGRLDLSAFTAALTPAYASDLMATAQGTVTSVVTFQDYRVFAVSGVGIFSERSSAGTRSRVTLGTLAQGAFTFGLPDHKVPYTLDVRHLAFPDAAGYVPSLTVDDTAVSVLGAGVSGATYHTYSIAASQGERVDVTHSLYSPGGSITPTITRCTLLADPVPGRSRLFTVPLLLSEKAKDLNGGDVSLNPGLELRRIEGLVSNGLVVDYQEGGDSRRVKVQDYEWRPSALTADRRSWNGVCTVRLKDESVLSPFHAAVTASTSSASSLTVAPPAYMPGEFLVAVVFGLGIVTMPTTWTTIAAPAAQLGIYGKVAKPGEPSLVISMTPANPILVVMLSYRDVRVSSVTPSTDAGVGGSVISFTAITTTAPNTVVLEAVAALSTTPTTITPDGLVRGTVGAPSGGSRYDLTVADTVQAAAGSTGSRSALLSSPLPSDARRFLVALAPS